MAIILAHHSLRHEPSPWIRPMWTMRFSQVFRPPMMQSKVIRCMALRRPLFTIKHRMYDVIFRCRETRRNVSAPPALFSRCLGRTSRHTCKSAPHEAAVLSWRDRVAEEAVRDRNWWGWAPDGGQNNLYPDLYITNGVDRFDHQFSCAPPPAYGKHSITNTALTVGINKTGQHRHSPGPVHQCRPTPLWTGITIPPRGNQDEEYVQLTNTNSYAVDISGGS